MMPAWRSDMNMVFSWRSDAKHGAYLIDDLTPTTMPIPDEQTPSVLPTWRSDTKLDAYLAIWHQGLVIELVSLDC